MTQQYQFDFNTNNTLEDFWDYLGPAGSGITGNGGIWRNTSGSTPSNNTGPSNGQNADSYMYIETSSPHRNGDQYTMTTKNTIDFSLYQPKLTFWYNSNVDVSCQCLVEVWDGFQWFTEDLIEPAAQDDTWYSRTVDISDNYINTDGLIRFRIITPNSGTSYRKDFALDTITLLLESKESDDFIIYFSDLNIRKERAFGRVFKATGKTPAEVQTLLSNFLANLNNFDFTRYIRGVAIKEDGRNVVHVITEKDKP